MKCLNLVILIVIFYQINGYKIDCPGSSSTCTIKNVRNTSDLYELLTNKTALPTKQTKRLKFENSSLDFLSPEIFIAFPDLLTLSAVGLQIQYIDENQFKSAYQLKELSLSNNKLEIFNTDFLSESKNLQTLDVSKNGISILDFDALLENNKKLNKLNLSNNKMTNAVISENIVEYDASHNLLEHYEVAKNSKLIYLDLSGNRLRSDAKGNFKHLKSIKHLNVSDMMLEPLEIGLFVEMERLESLILRNTGITKIEYGTFSNLKSLVILDLSYNKLSDLDVNMLLVFSNLKSLYLSGNQIVTINSFDIMKSVLPNLEEISIEQNNWNCLFLSQFHYFLKLKDVKIVKLENPKKDSTNVMLIECNQEIPSSTEELKATSLEIEDSSTTETSIQESNQSHAIFFNKCKKDSSFYNVVISVSTTLLVVCILLKLKKYIKFNCCQTYKIVDEKDLRSPPTEMV